MVYVIRSYEVPSVNVTAFTTAFDENPPWQRLSYALHGHLHTGLLIRSKFPTAFVSLAIWQGEDQFLAAEGSAEYLKFNRTLRILAASSQSLGVFRYRCHTVQMEIADYPVRISTGHSARTVRQ